MNMRSLVDTIRNLVEAPERGVAQRNSGFEFASRSKRPDHFGRALYAGGRWLSDSLQVRVSDLFSQRDYEAGRILVLAEEWVRGAPPGIGAADR